MNHKSIELKVQDVPLRVMTGVRQGSGPPLVCLHGFGSTHEDFAGLASLPGFEGRSILAYDAPGCRRTECPDLGALSIDFLRRTAQAVIEKHGLEVFHLIGHSMGGLTALKLAEAMPERVLSLTNIEGNLAPEDCFLSRQIIEHAATNDDDFLDRFIARVGNGPDPSATRYGAGLRRNVRAGAVAPIFRSMVTLSDNGRLIDIFLGLPIPRMFVYGDRNRTLSYLGQLGGTDVRLAEIPGSGHFPMYANPSALWRAIGGFIDNVDKSNG